MFKCIHVWTSLGTVSKAAATFLQYSRVVIYGIMCNDTDVGIWNIHACLKLKQTMQTVVHSF